MSLSIIFLAGGVGSRMSDPKAGPKIPKQYQDLNGKPLFRYSFDVLKSLGEVVVVADPQYRHYFEGENVIFADPGKRRQDSVKNGFDKASGEWILVHDAARPFINLKEIEQLSDAAKLYHAATLASPLKFTVKEADENLLITKTLDRELLWEIQTPQMVASSVLAAGFTRAITEDITVTDDVSLAELAGVYAKIVKGSDKNLKITTDEDLLWARYRMSHAQV